MTKPSQDLLSPDEIIDAIENLKNSHDDSYTIDSIIRVAEESAQKILIGKGYHPHLDIYGYVDNPKLSTEENREASKQSDRAEWVNEAIHLIQHPDLEVMAASFTILESSSLRNYIYFGEMEKAIISMANIQVCSLLHLDQRKEKITALMREKFQEIKPDLDLGQSTRNRIKKFANRYGTGQTEKQEPELERWRQCAEAIKKENPHIKSKSALARAVKRRLKLVAAFETIRKRI